MDAKQTACYHCKTLLSLPKEHSKYWRCGHCRKVNGRPNYARGFVPGVLYCGLCRFYFSRITNAIATTALVGIVGSGLLFFLPMISRRGPGVSFYGYIRLESRIDGVESPRESRRRHRGVARAGLAGSRRTSPPKICPGRRVRRCFLRGQAGSPVLRTGNRRRRRQRRSRAGSGRGRASGPAGGDGVGTKHNFLRLPQRVRGVSSPQVWIACLGKKARDGVGRR